MKMAKKKEFALRADEIEALKVLVSINDEPDEKEEGEKDDD